MTEAEFEALGRWISQRSRIEQKIVRAYDQGHDCKAVAKLLTRRDEIDADAKRILVRV